MPGRRRPQSRELEERDWVSRDSRMISRDPRILKAKSLALTVRSTVVSVEKVGSKVKIRKS